MTVALTGGIGASNSGPPDPHEVADTDAPLFAAYVGRWPVSWPAGVAPAVRIRVFVRAQVQGLDAEHLSFRVNPGGEGPLTGGIARAGERVLLYDGAAGELAARAPEVEITVLAAGAAPARVLVRPSLEIERLSHPGRTETRRWTEEDGRPVAVELQHWQFAPVATLPPWTEPLDPASRARLNEAEDPGAAGHVQPNGRGVRLQTEVGGRRIVVAPEVTAQNGISIAGALGSTLGSRAAVGALFLAGGDKREVIVNAGWQLSAMGRLFLTGGHLRQSLDMPFAAGNAMVPLVQTAGGVNYQLALTQGILQSVDVTAYHARTGSRDLGTMLRFDPGASTIGEAELFEVPRRVAGGSVHGFESRLTVRPFPSALLDADIGAERLEYDLAAGPDSTVRFTSGLQWMQQLPHGYSLIASTASHAAQRVHAVGLTRSLNRHQFGLTFSSIQGRDGAPDDTQLRWTHAYTFGQQPAGRSPGRSIDAETRTPARSMLELVSARPAFVPAQVIARVDETVRAVRLVAVERAGLPEGTTISPATAAITLPAGVTRIVGIRRNGAPFTNTGQFAIVAQRLEVRPREMEVPHGGGRHEYVLTLESTAGGTTHVSVRVSAGSVKVDRIEIREEEPRTTPDPFAFESRTGVAPRTLVVSDAATISGINRPVPISVEDGEYAIDDGAFTSAGGVIRNSQRVRLRHLSAAGSAAESHTRVTIGGVAATFTSTTTAPSLTPLPFELPPVESAEPGSLVTSAEAVVSGIDAAVEVSISGGEYSIDGGPFTSSPGRIAQGQRIRVRVMSPVTPGTSATAVLTVGGRSATFTVSSAAVDITPDPFSLAGVADVAPNTAVVSRAVTVSGINTAAPISISGGEYAIDGGAYTAAAGRVGSGQSVTVRLTSAATPATVTTATLVIGTESAAFNVTTVGADTTPDAFGFTARSGVPLGAAVTSDSITVSGINVPTPISISGGEYAINSGSYTTGAGTVSTGQTVSVRVVSASTPASAITATLTIGTASAAFEVTTVAADTTPGPFSFAAQSGVALASTVTSNSISVTGINTAAAVSIAGGEYSIDGAAYTAGAGTIANGQSVTVRQVSSATPGTTTTAALTIGGVSGSFSVTTIAADTMPDPFSFAAQTNAAPGATVTSAAIVVSGINAPAGISITGGEYSIDGGGYTAGAGTVANGQSVTVRQVASAVPGTTTTATLTVGGVSGTFSVTTIAADTTPDPFSFAAQTSAALGATVTSTPIVVGGINAPAAISIVGGLYSIGGGTYTSGAGTVVNGQSVTVRLTSSASPATTTTATLTIGGVSAGFSVTTEAVDTTPAPFTFTTQTGVNRNATIVSNAVVLTGFNSAAVITVAGDSTSRYSVNNGPWVSSPGMVEVGDMVEVRHRAASTGLTSTTTTLTIGDVIATFTTVTRP